MDPTSLAIIGMVGLATAAVIGLTRLAARYCAIPARRIPPGRSAEMRPARPVRLPRPRRET